MYNIPHVQIYLDCILNLQVHLGSIWAAYLCKDPRQKGITEIRPPLKKFFVSCYIIHGPKRCQQEAGLKKKYFQLVKNSVSSILLHVSMDPIPLKCQQEIKKFFFSWFFFHMYSPALLRAIELCPSNSPV